MKKTLLILTATAISLVGLAAVPQQYLQKSPVCFDKDVRLSGPGSLKTPSMMKAPAKINSIQDVITSVEGTRQEVAITGTGYTVSSGKIYPYHNETVASHAIFGNDDEVYIYNILPHCLTNSYVKGKKVEDKVVVDLPQTVLWLEGAEDGYNLCMYEYKEYEEEDGQMSSWYFLADDTSITFSVAEDGTLTAEGLSENKLLSLGVASNLNWAGYGASELSIAPFNEHPVELPADFEVSEDFWVIGCGEYGLFVNFAQGGDELYFQGIAPIIPEAWMKASLTYDEYTATVSIHQNQYIGVYDGYFLYTKCAKAVLGKDGYYTYEALPDDAAYELIWDFEEQTMIAKDPEILLLFNVGSDKIDPYFGVSELDLTHYDSYDGIPAKPYGLEYLDYADVAGYGAFFFNVPAITSEGDYLLTKNLYYVLYIDGEEWSFDAEDYEMSESLDEIPWNFDDYWICFGEDSEIQREVDFFVSGISTIGVQSVYRYDGKETRSEIATLYLDGTDPGSVGSQTSEKKIKDVRYFSIDGRKVAYPISGIVLKKVEFEDGSIRTFKSIVR